MSPGKEPFQLRPELLLQQEVLWDHKPLSLLQRNVPGLSSPLLRTLRSHQHLASALLSSDTVLTPRMTLGQTHQSSEISRFMPSAPM